MVLFIVFVNSMGIVEHPLLLPKRTAFGNQDQDNKFFQLTILPRIESRSSAFTRS